MQDLLLSNGSLRQRSLWPAQGFVMLVESRGACHEGQGSSSALCMQGDPSSALPATDKHLYRAAPTVRLLLQARLAVKCLPTKTCTWTPTSALESAGIALLLLEALGTCLGVRSGAGAQFLSRPPRPQAHLAADGHVEEQVLHRDGGARQGCTGLGPSCIHHAIPACKGQSLLWLLREASLDEQEPPTRAGLHRARKAREAVIRSGSLPIRQSPALLPQVAATKGIPPVQGHL